jgi:hypothetical protein
MPDRKSVTVQGKSYPLKTDSERAASKAAPTAPAPTRESNVKVSVPSVDDSPRQVLLALVIALVIFLAAGGRIEKVLAKARGIEPPADNQPFTANTVFAWGFLFVSLMVLADLKPTQKLSVAFAYLILLSVLLEFGPQAFANLSKLTQQAAPVTPPISAKK